MRILQLSILTLLAGPLANADDIFVNISATSGSNDGSDWENGFLKLQDALDVAQSDDVVHVAEGVYYPDEGQSATQDSEFDSFILPKGLILLGGYRSDGVARNSSSFPTILSGDIQQDDVNSDENQIAESSNNLVGRNSLHVVQTPYACEIDGFIITAGEATFDASTGGGLLSMGDDVVVRNCRLQGNLCNGRGGAAMVDSGSTQFINCFFMGNSSNSRGGALASLSGAKVNLVNCAFLGNLAERGGAMNFNDSTATLTNCSIAGNSGTINGGGIQAAVSSTLELHNTIIWNNLAAGSLSLGGSSLNMLSGSSYLTTTCLIENEGGSDPLFVSTPNPGFAPRSLGNLDLLSNSPAKDAGTAGLNEETFDIIGRQRIDASSIDIGAYELTTEIFVDSTATNGSNDGSSWQDAYLHLQDALAEAVSGDFVRVAAGIYYPDEGVGQTNDDRESTFELSGGVEMRGGYPAGGGLSDPETNLTILSGDLAQDDLNSDGNHIIEDVTQISGNNAYSVVSASFGSVSVSFDSVTLSGLTITAGLANEIDHSTGGGVSIKNLPLQIEDCHLIGNQAASRGGGLYFSAPTENLEILSCRFSANAMISTAAITDSSGGGLHSASSELLISDCIFKSNQASSSDAAFAAFGLGSDSSCLIERTSITSNQTDPVASGRIVRLQSFDQVDLTECSFLGNDVGQGTIPRILSLIQLPKTQLRNCLFAGNRAATTVYFQLSPTPEQLPSVSFRNCTIAGNEGIPFNVPANQECRLNWENCVVDQPLVSMSHVTTSFSHCLFAGQPGGVDGNLPDTTSPGFVDPIPASSAPTAAGDYRLLQSSALIDAGLSDSFTSSNDLVGLPRISDGDGNGTATVDIGAYESQSIPDLPEVEITAIDYDPSNGQVTLTVESSVSSSFTAQYNSVLLPGEWDLAQTGSLTAGTNSVTLSGASYGWPVEEVFFRIVLP